MIYIYVMRNRLLSAYEIPVFDECDKDSYRFKLQKGIILDPDTAKKYHFDETELYYLGKFDVLTCQFDLLDKPEFLLDCGDVYRRRRADYPDGDKNGTEKN